MKKTTARLLSLLLTLLLVCGLAPLGMPRVRAATRPPEASGTVAQRIAQLTTVFPAGSYFSANGAACTHVFSQTCTNCQLSYIMQSMGYTGTMGNTDGWTCVSFARFAFWYIFGLPYDTTGYDDTKVPTGTTIINPSLAKAGDIMVWGSQAAGHYALCLGNDRYYQVNVGGTPLVSFNAPYTSYTKYYAVRANNYDAVNQAAVPAPAAGNVAQRLAQVAARFPNGSQFSVNGTACANADCDGCPNCALSGILPSLGYTGGLNGINECYQGVAFARYVWWYVFGVAYNQSAYTGVAPTGASLVPAGAMKPGDLVVFNAGQTTQRVGIYLGDGKYAFGNLDLSNKVSYGIPLPAGLTPTYVFHPNSYDTINSQTVTYDYLTNGGQSTTAPATAVVAIGNAVDLTPAASKTGWSFKGWNTNQSAAAGLTALDMPGQDITLYAIFELIPPSAYAVTVSSGGNGTASANPTNATAGTVITLTATADSGCQFKEWQVVSGGVTVADNKFTMPANAVEVKAIFELIPAVPADKAALNQRLGEIGGTANNNYTEDTWNAFQSALQTARTVAGNLGATQAQVDTALGALNSAYSALTQKVIVQNKSGYIWLWGKQTVYPSDFLHWILCIFCFGWIWMAF